MNEATPSTAITDFQHDIEPELQKLISKITKKHKTKAGETALYWGTLHYLLQNIN